MPRICTVNDKSFITLLFDRLDVLQQILPASCGVTKWSRRRVIISKGIPLEGA